MYRMKSQLNLAHFAAVIRQDHEHYPPGFNAQNKMLDEFGKEFGLEDQDWRREKPWYEPEE